MENILEIRDLEGDEYNYSVIKLSSPSIQAGNNYYTNITIGDRDKNLYIQFPKCITKAGYVKNNTKCYTDLVFSASDTKIIKWLENFESYLQSEIYKKRDIWFDTEITLDDIQELMTPIMRSYKSGKNILIRCNIKNHKCSVYDENEVLLDLEKFTVDREIIPLVSINGVKFSSRNFAIELNLTQVMILTSKEDLEKNCLIKAKAKATSSTSRSSTRKVDNASLFNSLEPESKLKSEPDIQLEETKAETDIQLEETKAEPDIQLEEAVPLEETVKPENDNILLDISDSLEISNDKTEKTERQDILGDTNNVLDEIDLDNLDLETIETNKDDNKTNKDSDNDKINIREPQEIYYEIYRNALVKANTLKRNTIAAFLNAKNIRSKYNLENLDLDLDSDLDTDLRDDFENGSENEDERDLDSIAIYD